MTKYETFEPTVNPIIARLKAQAGQSPDVEDKTPSDSRFGLLGESARAKLKAQLSGDSEAVTLSSDDLIAHKSDGQSFSSETTKLAKLNPKDPKHATKRPNLEPLGLLPGKGHRQAGIYKMAFEDGCFMIGWASDLYGKCGGVVSRINRNIIPRYPRGTQISDFVVLSSERSDLKSLKEKFSKDPQFIQRLERIKNAKPSQGSVVEKYKERLAGKSQKSAKTNEVLEAHREQERQSGGMSALERLRKKGGKLSVVSKALPTDIKSRDEAGHSVDWDAFDAEFAEFTTRT